MILPFVFVTSTGASWCLTATDTADDETMVDPDQERKEAENDGDGDVAVVFDEGGI